MPLLRISVGYKGAYTGEYSRLMELVGLVVDEVKALMSAEEKFVVGAWARATVATRAAPKKFLMETILASERPGPSW